MRDVDVDVDGPGVVFGPVEGVTSGRVDGVTATVVPVIVGISGCVVSEPGGVETGGMVGSPEFGVTCEPAAGGVVGIWISVGLSSNLGADTQVDEFIAGFDLSTGGRHQFLVKTTRRGKEGFSGAVGNTPVAM